MNLEIMTYPVDKKDNVVPGGKYSFHPYGKSCAAAITVAKTGGVCVLCTKLADDMNGNRLKKYYEACGVGTGAITLTNEAQTGFSVTTYDGTGICEHVVSKGANVLMTKKDVDEAFGTFPDFFLVPQEDLLSPDFSFESTSDVKASVKPSSTDETSAIPSSISDAEEQTAASNVTDPRGRNSLALYACNKAMEKKVDMIVDYDSAAASLPLSSFSGIKALIISDDALYRVTGFYPNSDDRIKRSLVSLSSKIPAKYYVVHLANKAVFVYDGNAFERIDAPKELEELVKTDSFPKMKETFVGAFITEYMATKNVVRASIYAMITSLLTKSNDGVLEHVPTKAEVDEIIKEKGINTLKW